MRKLVVGNWKMNGLASSLAEIEALKGLTGKAACDIVVCPPFTLIEKAAERAGGSALKIGAQDCHPEISGAYTGDVSAEMLVDAGACLVIVGHSERRVFHHESSALVARKAVAAHKAELAAIICVGETRGERDDGKTLEVVDGQLRCSIPAGATSSNTAIAYEPVWAIGTGLIPTTDQIQEIHASIRQLVVELLGEDGRQVRILYGGSVKASNAAEILGVANVDGALVGGASLKATDFAQIIAAAA